MRGTVTNSFEVFNGKVPDISELGNRFLDINVVIPVEIVYNGYLAEIKAICPFKGIATVGNVINILNKDIIVKMKDGDLIKLRNSIIYYNEYFCPSAENVDGFTPAYTAFNTIEYQYVQIVGEKELDDKLNNPYKTNVLEGIVDTYEHTKSDVDDAFERYVREHQNKARMQSLKSKHGSMAVKEPVIPLHAVMSRNVNSSVYLDYEYCYDDVDFVDEDILQ